MADTALLTHNLRFYLQDITVPYTYEDEELMVYLTAAGRQIGIDTTYSWATLPTAYESVVVKIAHLNWLLRKATEVGVGSGVKLEDIEVQSGSGDTLLGVIKATREAIDADLSALGIGVPDALVSSVPLFDRATHTMVPYGAGSPPPAALLSNTVLSATDIRLAWTRYKNADFWMYRLQDSIDGQTWETIYTTDDPQEVTRELSLTSGTYYYRVWTKLNNGLETVSNTVTVAIA